MDQEHPERPEPRAPGAPRDPDPADESPTDRDGDTEAQDREHAHLPGIATGEEPPAAS